MSVPDYLRSSLAGFSRPTYSKRPTAADPVLALYQISPSGVLTTFVHPAEKFNDLELV